MMNVTLGRYLREENVISSLDSRTKLFALILYIITLFCFSGLFTLFLSAAALFSVIRLSRIRLSYITRGLGKPFLLFLFFALLIAVFEENGVRRAFFTISRLSLTVLSSSVFTLTTKPKDIARAIEKSLGKGRLERPVHILSTIIMIAFRFLPLLLDEAVRIMDAQKSRGFSFSEKGIVKKCRAFLPLLVPLFVSAFHRADALALALDARGYNGRRSTSLYPLKYTKRDRTAYVLLVLYALSALLAEKLLYV